MKSSFARPNRDRAPTKRRSSSSGKADTPFHHLDLVRRKKRWPTALRRRSLRLLGRGATIDGKKLEPRSLRRPHEHERAGGRNADRTAGAPGAERALQQRQRLHFARSARDARLARRSRPTGQRKVRARRALHRRPWFHRERDRRFHRETTPPGTRSCCASRNIISSGASTDSSGCCASSRSRTACASVCSVIATASGG